ncbi:hypothetical protein DICPUDRAFT_83742 [Dictyostelium purpureum]|uniref:CDP-alcohol phosphatidyltransferase n=1 Tax=Dictyostelium purpureum TaxID=5786 RepID=F1A0H1_DICPU|nr:uncharacterized protein DICPUDRAFT_83742 [Dictyostelium purpureum]EGC30308.1 hypothetical protein DICPUDRAFT_83742 [Dictyostelium purpureum]|eukprot:XP_003293159.1 hypothetical protein DICPUDRAFT_83742 [Dictyostelium purpureum]
MGVYVSQRARDNIKKYKYSGCDSSFISIYIMTPFWNWFVNLLPKSFAPNLVTLFGFISIIVSYLVTLYYMPQMSGEAPKWLYLFNAFCIFIYQTMDAVDGKQARRVNASSGLGELFDHGCDAMITFLVMQTFQSSIQVGCNQISFFTTLFIMLVFFTAQWEQYHTGIMNLGYFGPTESQFGMMTGHILTYFFGPEFWSRTINILNFNIQINHFVLILIIAGGVGTIFLNIYAICKRGNNSVVSSFIDLLPIISLIIFSVYWGQNSTVNILETEGAHYFMASFGILAAFITGKLILARICMDKLSPIQTIMVPLIFVFLNIYKFNGTLFDEILFSKIYFYSIFVLYIHFAYDVVTSLTEVLDIYCFKLKPHTQSSNPQSSSKKTK